MTGLEIKTMANSILDDTIEETLFYQLLNVAKNRVEEMRPWQFLKVVDTTQTASTGDNYLTMKTLPTDFRYDYKMFVGDDYTEYLPIPFELRKAYKDSAKCYYIDLANSQFAICGTVSTGGTINLYYIKTTPDVAEGTSPIWPARFHSLLAYMVAGYFMMGVDTDDLYARMSTENKMAAKEIKRSMVMWDAHLKGRTLNHQTGFYTTDYNFNDLLAKM